MEQIKEYTRRGPFGDRIISLIADINDCNISVPRSISNVVQDINTAYHVRKTIDDSTFGDRLSEIDDLIRKYEKNCKCKRI